MTVLEIILVVGMLAGIGATIAQLYGKAKLAAILGAVAGGVDKAKPILSELKVAKEAGRAENTGAPILVETDAKRIMIEAIKGEVGGIGMLKDLDEFLSKNGLNK